MNSTTKNEGVFSSIFFDKYDGDKVLAGTCPKEPYYNFLFGLYIRFKDTFFFSYLIQFLLVYLMYMNAGSGHYWTMLFYASLAGMIASFLENATLSFECSEAHIEQRHNGIAVLYLFGELFWIITEYSIPYLNLIKMKAIAKSDTAKTISYVIYGLAIPFIGSRFAIGYSRYKNGYLNDEGIEILHGFAFLFMGVADLICTIFIIHFINKYNNRSSTHGNDLTNHIQQSSYTILITVDIVSLLLSALYIIVTIVNYRNDSGTLTFMQKVFAKDLPIPFHCFKSVFLLILATDALLFKYGASNNTSLRDSSGNVVSNMNESSIKVTNKSRISTYRPTPDNSNVSHLNTPALRSPKVVSMSAFGYNPSNDIYSQNENSRTQLNSNYNIDQNDIDIRPFPSEQFGFLHHGEYNELLYKNNNNQIKY